MGIPSQGSAFLNTLPREYGPRIGWGEWCGHALHKLAHRPTPITRSRYLRTHGGLVAHYNEAEAACHSDANAQDYPSTKDDRQRCMPLRSTSGIVPPYIVGVEPPQSVALFGADGESTQENTIDKLCDIAAASLPPLYPGDVGVGGYDWDTVGEHQQPMQAAIEGVDTKRIAATIRADRTNLIAADIAVAKFSTPPTITEIRRALVHFPQSTAHKLRIDEHVVNSADASIGSTKYQLAMFEYGRRIHELVRHKQRWSRKSRAPGMPTAQTNTQDGAGLQHMRLCVCARVRAHMHRSCSHSMHILMIR